MQRATEHLRQQARLMVEAALERVPLKAAAFVATAACFIAVGAILLRSDE